MEASSYLKIIDLLSNSLDSPNKILSQLKDLALKDSDLSWADTNLIEATAFEESR